MGLRHAGQILVRGGVVVTACRGGGRGGDGGGRDDRDDTGVDRGWRWSMAAAVLRRCG